MIFSVREHSGATASSRYESVSIQEQLRVPISSHHLVVLEVVLESNSNDESMSLMGTYGHPTHPNSTDLNRPGTPTWPHDEAPASSSKIHQRAHEFQRFDEVCGYSPSFGVVQVQALFGGSSICSVLFTPNFRVCRGNNDERCHLHGFYVPPWPGKHI